MHSGTAGIDGSAGSGAATSSNTTLTVVGYTAPAPATNLVGAWLTGGTNLADTSGFSLNGLHDGFPVGETNSPGTNKTSH